MIENTVRLGDVAVTTSGSTPSRSNNKYWNGSVPWIKSGQLKDNIIYRCDEFITEQGLKNSSCKIVKKDTLLLALYGATAGKLAFTGIDAATNQAVCAIYPNDDVLDKKFLYYYLLSLRSKILNDATGGAQPNISQSYVKELRIRLIPLPAQKRIAEILGKADALCKKDKQLLQYYDDLAQSLFIDMFGDPVRNEKGWEIKKLGELSTKILSGNTPVGGNNVYVDRGVTFFRSQNVWKNELIYDDIAYIDNATHTKMKNSGLMNLDILMTKTGRINTENSSLGRAALFEGDDNSANINGHVYLIRLKKGHSHRFILKILTSKEYREHIRNVCVGGIDKRQLNKEHIQDFPIIYPPNELQNKFALQVQNIEQQKEKLKAQMQESENLFQVLLQNAFNGGLN